MAQLGLERVALSATAVSGVAGAQAAEARAVGVTSAGLLDQLLSVVEGVDLNLDRFNLSEPHRRPLAVGGALSEEGRWEGDAFLGRAFWTSIDSKEHGCDDDDTRLLRELFNPHLSDRREEGDLFVPPDPSPSNVGGLRRLLKEEREVRQARLDRFLSPAFSPGRDAAGPLFPSSWSRPAPSLAEAPRALYAASPEALAAAPQVLASGAPLAFDERTEDGMRFRAYRAEGLEVRTTHAHDGEETIAAVFSTRPPSAGLAMDVSCEAMRAETIIKVTEYVERRLAGQMQTDDFNFFIVLETEKGHLVVTEELLETGNGQGAWRAAEPHSLEVRIAKAKVLRVADLRTAGNNFAPLALGELMAASSFGQQQQPLADRAQCRGYSRGVYDRAMAGHLAQKGEGAFEDVWCFA
jgi:hypothetical protein